VLKDIILVYTSIICDVENKSLEHTGTDILNEDLIGTYYINNLTYVFINNQNLFRFKKNLVTSNYINT